MKKFSAEETFLNSSINIHECFTDNVSKTFWFSRKDKVQIDFFIMIDEFSVIKMEIDNNLCSHKLGTFIAKKYKILLLYNIFEKTITKNLLKLSQFCLEMYAKNNHYILSYTWRSCLTINKCYIYFYFEIFQKYLTSKNILKIKSNILFFWNMKKTLSFKNFIKNYLQSKNVQQYVFSFFCFEEILKNCFNKNFNQLISFK